MSQEANPSGRKSFLRELAGVIIPALLLAVVIQTFLYRPFRIPSESMKPTLLIGDYLFVSKYSYGYSRYSLPFSPPLFAGRIMGKPPQRGDVAVFKLPIDDSQDLIKRVIGLPGERIQMRAGVLHINGIPVKLEHLQDYVDPEEDPPARIERWRETLPNGVAHVILNLENNGPLDDTPEYRVPPGHYFMMGDNRDNSTDSRVLSEVGYVPFENFVGRAEIIFFSIGNGASAWQIWRWPVDIRWNRLFTWVR
jgi:signal peptidase I